jgi:hypothetical protein
LSSEHNYYVVNLSRLIVLLVQLQLKSIWSLAVAAIHELQIKSGSENVGLIGRLACADENQSAEVEP